MTTTYTDKLGRKIMEDVSGAKTYYVYNDAGLISHIIQPAGSALLHSTPSNIHTSTGVILHCFIYTYDSEFRLLTKDVPGITGIYSYTYDRLDRVIVQTDPNGFKTFTKYDILGRVIQTGKYTGTASPTHTETLYESPNTTAPHYYTTNQAFPTANTEVYALNYYDDLDYTNDDVDDVSYQANPTVAGGTYPPSFSTDHPSTEHHPFARGKLTHAKNGVLNSNGTVPTVFVSDYSFFDKWGRELQHKTAHQFTGADVVWYKYHFAGWELVKSREHVATVGGTASSLFLTYKTTYDHAGRPLTKTIRVNNGTETLVTTEAYTEVSQLKTKTLGTGIQTIDYKYNIRGWLTEINDVANCNTDLFRMKLNYEVGNSNINATARWNGNISSVEWRVGSSCMVGGSTRNKTYYGFTYDNMNRLTQAKYAEYTTLYTNFDRYNENLTYNLSGDILTVARQGYNGSGYAQIDALTYAYPTSGTFRLSSVTETSSGTLGFTINAGQTLSTYGCDNNGNITSRTNVGYSTISYNHLNLPHTITGAAATINNSYDASGRKWTSTTAGVVTTYFDAIEYEGNALKAIYHADGRIEKLVGGTYEYQYYIKDHLGNIRILLKSGPTLMQEYHYYPFGMEQGGTWVAPQGLTQKYKYNGKEFFGSGLGWYDYGARWYDPSVGRFVSVDNLADDPNQTDKSAFAYAWDNPVSLTDPDGNCPSCKTLKDYAVFHLNATVAAGKTLIESGQFFVNPVKTYEGVKGIVKAVSNPKETYQNIKSSVGNAYDTYMHGTPAEAGRVQGTSNAMVAEALVGSKGLGAIGKIDKANDLSKVYRVYGGDSRAEGFSWTPVNPNSIDNFRDMAGLPSGGASGSINTGQFVIEGTIKKTDIISNRKALPLDGNKGGLKEYIVDPSKVKIERVSGANPNF